MTARPQASHVIGAALLLASLASAAAGASGAVPQTPALSSPTVLVFETEDGPVVVELHHEALYDPRESTLFYTWGDVAFGPRGRQFHLDRGDDVVRVLDESGEHLADIGSEGQGPGEFTEVWSGLVSPAGELWVFERRDRMASRFDLEGSYVGSARLPFAAHRTLGMLFADADTLVVAAPFPGETYGGKALHAFEVRGPLPRRELVHVRSFGEPAAYDEALHRTVGSGRISLDLDGGVLYTQRSPYSVRKYTADGELLWEIDDPGLIPPATEFYVEVQGRRVLGRHPRASSIFPIADDTYLHTLTYPPEGVPPEAPSLPEGVDMRRVFELIRFVEGNEKPSRWTVESPEPIAYHARDPRGRLYGTWDPWVGLLIRSEAHFRRRP